MPNLLIYGATGYSGRLIVQRALARGLKPVIAGRDRHAIESMASAYGLEWTTVSVDQPAGLRSMTASAAVLLNAAGPFTATSAPLIDACLATGTHYLDISGEADTVEETVKWHDAAIRRGVMLMPAVGFEVVASDCLAAHVARRLPGATSLKLGFDKSQATSRGSLMTSIEMSGQGVLVRHDGKLVSVAPGSLTCNFDYGSGPAPSLAVSFSDVSSAFFSTGIPNIETYLRATLPVWGAVTANQYWGWLLSTPPWQSVLKGQLEWLAPESSHQERKAGWAVLVAEAKDASGRCARSRMHTGDVYWYTALSAVGVAEKCLAGEWKSGFQTPSRVYGPEFALSFEGASREDIVEGRSTGSHGHDPAVKGPRRTPPPPTYSTARLDSLICPVMIDSRELQSCLPAHAQLSLPRLPHVPEGRHPIIVEIWRVQDGMIEVGGVTAHRMWELASAAAGIGFGGSAGAAIGAGIGGAAGAASGGGLGMWFGPLGWWWGVTAGAAAGAAAGATMMATTGATHGARLAAAAGRRTSEINSRIIGTYNEIIVTVPCRRTRRGGFTDDFAFVLGTYTDSMASILGEWLVGWGFRKSQAFGARTKDGALEVGICPTGAPFRVVSRQTSTPGPPNLVRLAATHVLTSLSHPMLGVLPANRLMISLLDRSFEDPAVSVVPVSVGMESGDGFLQGLRPFASDIKAIGNDDPWGAFVVSGLPVMLSYPRADDD